MGIFIKTVIIIFALSNIVGMASARSEEARILFSSDMSSPATLSVYSMNSNGGDVRLHLPSAVHRRGEYEASVSPDGRQLAFTTYRYGGWKIAIADIDGSNVRRVTMDPQYAYDPVWSPKGTQIFYRRIVNGNGAYFQGNADIYSINIDGSENKNLSNAPKEHARNAAISPDGRTVLYDAFVGNNVHIMRMNVDGTDRRRIAGESDVMFAPSWSPDGVWVAHLRQDTDGFIDVWRMKHDGSEAENLTKSQQHSYKPVSDKLDHWFFETSWSPDGTSIAFVSDYEDLGNADIYTVDVTDHRITRLTQNPTLDLHPFWFRPQ